MNRKYIIIAVIAILIVIIVAIYLIFFNSKETQISEIENQQTAAQLPTNALPTNISEGSAIKVNDRDNQVQIKDSYNKYIDQNVDDIPSYKKNGISIAYSMDDQNGKMVDLDSFLDSVGATINPKIKNLIGTNYYGLFYCPNEKGGKDFGMTFELGNSDPQKLQSVNSQAKEALRQWEPYILKDLRSILFPEKNFSEEQINQSLVFKEGEFRYADVILPGGEKSSINYVVDIYPPDHPSSVNYIYIATSKDCLQKSLGSLFDF